ncbi:GNAT family N-acetyltransferase [Paenibacillus gansuensis]|uniref:GNAT family N-acetyltransferase n=1 Tax=Paenibacillus gansuensis TaxID=306542 RepID=A0ABW5PK67_9BACL
MILLSETIYLRQLTPDDADMMLDLRVQNRQFLQLYEPIRPESFYTLEGQRDALNKGVEDWELDRGYAFGLFLKENDTLIGRAALSNVVRGVGQYADLGYFLDQEHTGKGYMTQAVSLITAFGFQSLRLHRIQAGVMPWNEASLAVLARAGFEREGIARKYIRINGRWEDHVILSLINDQEEDML